MDNPSRYLVILPFSYLMCQTQQPAAQTEALPTTGLGVPFHFMQLRAQASPPSLPAEHMHQWHRRSQTCHKACCDRSPVSSAGKHGNFHTVQQHPHPRLPCRDLQTAQFPWAECSTSHTGTTATKQGNLDRIGL